MSRPDYFAPVKYEPPERPRHIPLRKTLIGLAYAVGIFVLLYLSWLALQHFRPARKRALPPAVVHIGKPLKWRTLFSGQAPGMTQSLYWSDLISGDFDGNGDDEIILALRSGGGVLFEVDGTQQSLPLDGMDISRCTVAWDFNCDGSDELVISADNSTVNSALRQGVPYEKLPLNQTPQVIDLNGKLLAGLSGAITDSGSMFTCDIDGDGTLELLVRSGAPAASRGAYEMVAYAPGGKASWTCKPGENPHFPCHGDVDGDGMVELLYNGSPIDQILVDGVMQEPVPLAGWPAGGYAEGCLDLNGDGRDGVLINLLHKSGWSLAYLDCGTGALTALQVPASQSLKFMGIGPDSFALDVNQDGCRELVLTRKRSSSLLMFDDGGACIYYQEFGHQVFAMATAHAGGKDYLVVSRDDRLLIYP